MAVDLKSKITIIPDWPRPGIVCYDIAPLLSDFSVFKEIIDRLAELYLDKKIDLVVGIEARGFALAAAVAYRLGAGLVLIRKQGKLPPPIVAQEYSFEYASHIMEIQATAIKPGQRLIVVDDILATGGTMAAAVKLVKRLQGEIIGISFIVMMEFMAGSERLKGQKVHSLVKF